LRRNFSTHQPDQFFDRASAVQDLGRIEPGPLALEPPLEFRGQPPRLRLRRGRGRLAELPAVDIVLRAG
jgi:hypothetical protein